MLGFFISVSPFIANSIHWSRLPKTSFISIIFFLMTNSEAK
uniref:Uncharacterized protein n=1 Tax=Anguilla anguilla TaxID=7936 RepID=A0A0E9U7A8_ANGAN